MIINKGPLSPVIIDSPFIALLGGCAARISSTKSSTFVSGSLISDAFFSWIITYHRVMFKIMKQAENHTLGPFIVFWCVLPWEFIFHVLSPFCHTFASLLRHYHILSNTVSLSNVPLYIRPKIVLIISSWFNLISLISIIYLQKIFHGHNFASCTIYIIENEDWVQ